MINGVRLPLPYPPPRLCATRFKHGVARPRRSTEAVGSDAAWALSTASKVERIFKVSSTDASEFVQSLTEKLPTSAQLDGMLTTPAIVAAVKEAVASEMQLLRLEMRLMFTVMVIGLLLYLESSSLGAPFVACLLKVMSGP